MLGVAAVTYGFAVFVASLVTAWTEGLLAKVPQVRVIRAIDYLHYPEEKVLFALRFVAGLGTCFYFLRDSRVAGVAAFGTLYVLFMELAMVLTGARKMDLREYGRTARPLLALLKQSVFEGGIYFTNFFSLSRHVAHRQWHVVAAYMSFFLLFPWLGVLRGWPKPRDYRGGALLSKRQMLTTLPARLVTFAVIAVVASTTIRGRRRGDEATGRCHDTFLAYASSQFPVSCYYFTVLRFVGRSYVDIKAPGADPTAPPLLLDALATIYRACEPAIGGMCVLAFAAPALGYC